MPPRIPTREDFSPLASTLPHTLHFPSPPESTTTFLILFHGLGDHDVPFTSFARSLNLPGVLAISVRGTSVLPAALLGGFDDTPAAYWGDDLKMDPATGELDVDPGFEKAREAVVEKMIKGLLIEKLGWETRDIILFGFGQGGSLALGIASSLQQTPRITDVDSPAPSSSSSSSSSFKGVVTIGGPLPQSMVPSTSTRFKGNTSVLVCQLDEDAADAVKEEFENTKVVKWNGREIGMPRDKEEVLPLMQFFADRLKGEF